MIHGPDGSGHGRCVVRLNMEDIVREAGLSTASPVQYTLRRRQRIESSGFQIVQKLQKQQGEITSNAKGVPSGRVTSRAAKARFPPRAASSSKPSIPSVRVSRTA